MLLLREDMLDLGTDRGFLRIGLGGPPRHRLAGGLLAMDLAALAAIAEVVLIGLGAVGSVCPHIRSRVGRIDQTFAQPGTIVRRGIGGLLPADEAVPSIDADVRLVAEGRDREIAFDRAVGFDLALAGLEGP